MCSSDLINTVARHHRGASIDVFDAAVCTDLTDGRCGRARVVFQIERPTLNGAFSFSVKCLFLVGLVTTLR